MGQVSSGLAGSLAAPRGICDDVIAVVRLRIVLFPAQFITAFTPNIDIDHAILRAKIIHQRAQEVRRQGRISARILLVSVPFIAAMPKSPDVWPM